MNVRNPYKFEALLLTITLLAVYFSIRAILLAWTPFTGAGAAAPHAVAGRAPAPWQRAWTCPIGDMLIGAPAAWSNGWVATAGRGRMAVVDNAGRLRWSQTFSNVFFAGSPAVAGDTVFAVGSSGELLAVDVATGALRWQVAIDSACRHGPLAMQCGGTWQVVLLSSSDGVLRWFDAATGRELAQSQPTNESDGPPGTDGRMLAYGNCDATMYVFDLVERKPLAAIPVGAGLQAAARSAMPTGVMAGGMLVRDGLIYGGTGGGELVCARVADSNIVWRAPVADREAFNTPVAAGKRVLMSNHDGEVMAFDATSGTEVWQVSLSNVVKTLCVAGDAVFTVAGGALVGLRAADGRIFLRQKVGDDVDGPVWNGRTLAVAADGGDLIGFRPMTNDQ